jgi:hypothetical protein
MAFANRIKPSAPNTVEVAPSARYNMIIHGEVRRRRGGTCPEARRPSRPASARRIGGSERASRCAAMPTSPPPPRAHVHARSSFSRASIPQASLPGNPPRLARGAIQRPRPARPPGRRPTCPRRHPARHLTRVLQAPSRPATPPAHDSLAYSPPPPASTTHPTGSMIPRGTSIPPPRHTRALARGCAHFQPSRWRPAALTLARGTAIPHARPTAPTAPSRASRLSASPSPSQWRGGRGVRSLGAGVPHWGLGSPTGGWGVRSPRGVDPTPRRRPD